MEGQTHMPRPSGPRRTVYTSFSMAREPACSRGALRKPDKECRCYPMQEPF